MAWVKTDLVNQSLSEDDKGVRKASITYRVFCDGPDTAYQAISYVGYVKGAPCPIDAFCKAKGVSADLSDIVPGSLYYTYDVTINYSSEKEQYQDPRNEPGIWTRTLSGAGVTVDRDLDEKPLVNTAGDPIEGVELEEGYSQRTFTKNFSQWIDEETYAFKTNENSFLGFGPKRVKVLAIEQSSAFATVGEQQIVYFPGSITFLFKLDGFFGDTFERKLLNSGFRRKATEADVTEYAENEDLKPITVGQVIDILAPGEKPGGLPASAASFLNEAGDGVIDMTVDGAEPIYLDGEDFKLVETVSFSGLTSLGVF